VSDGKIVPLRRAPTPTPGEAAVPDAALLAAVAVGDVEALGALFDRHHRAVERFIGRLAYGFPSELGDLVQITFIEVRRAAGNFRGASAVRTWILSIAANVVRHHVRGETRRRAMITAATQRPPPLGGAPPDEHASHRQLLERLQQALAALPAELREAFVMCELEEVPGAEAARALGLRQGTLWWRLHEARKRLRAALEGGGA
jgi:RNA polymerase sigma-70 factor, ECF subfamily